MKPGSRIRNSDKARRNKSPGAKEEGEERKGERRGRGRDAKIRKKRREKRRDCECAMDL